MKKALHSVSILQINAEKRTVNTTKNYFKNAIKAESDYLDSWFSVLSADKQPL